jgi:hypothetical protein
MVIELFFKTREISALHTFALVVKTHEKWRKDLLSICAQYGFSEFLGPDFSTPDLFLQDRFSTKVRGRGFNPVSDKSVYLSPNYEPFTLRRDYPVSASIFRQIDDISRSALASLNLTQEAYGRPEHVGYQHAACLLLGISHPYKKGDVTAFSQVWHVVDEDGLPQLIASVPAPINESDMQYQIPTIPDVWQEISAHEVVSTFNFHNAQVNKMEAK